MRRSVLLLTTLAALPFFIGCSGSPTEKPQPPAAKLTRPSKRAPLPPPKKDVVIDPSVVQSAIKELTDGLTSSDPIIRSHAVEAMGVTVPAKFESQILKSIEDVSPLVRLSAAMTAGQLRLATAYQPLLAHVGDDDNQVQIAVRFALHRLGDTRLTHDLELFSRSDRPEIRGSTVMALGMLGEPTAVKILHPMQADRNPAVRLQVSEALYRLGDPQGLANLAAAAVSAYPDDQMIAYLALAEPRDTRILEHVRAGLTSDYDETRLVAARAMGMLGNDEGYILAQKGTTNVDPRKRLLAALAFGAIGRTDAAQYVAPLLQDSSQDVRIAAATAILQMNPDGPTRN